MIAIGSAIGTGLFFGAGESIKLAGPSILLSYAIGGIIMYIVIRALGEMTVHEPNAGSFSYYANKYIGNYAGFVAGWNYWFNYIIVSMLELTATTMFLDYWFPNASHWLIALNILIIFSAINLMNVKLYGEFEFWFAGIKVAVIITLIILGIYLIINNGHTSNNTSIHNLWSYGGFFANGYSGFLLSFVVVIFSFGGTELVGITAGEAENPDKTIPLAINGIILRILIFYIGTLAIILCLYPWSKINSHLSPFVDVFSKIGIAKAAAVMNFVAITAALSSLNSGIYGTARMAYSLSQQRNAPKILGRLNSKGIPYMAILFSLFFIFFTVILNYLYPKQIFGVLLAIAVLAAIINWVIILLTQIVFRKKVKLENIKYKIPLYPITSIIAIIFFVMIIITMTQMKDMAMAIYIAPLWLLVLSVGYWIKDKVAKHRFTSACE
ncbi:MAG: aromatic amino acid transporter AroP [Burkholderiales bacterium]|nr:aromatic amino acid transporter AroP [Burkholderiales bacterium]MCE3267998.1 aromatic amino acid transporter AroP [Burkholderiales bacterium]